MKLDLFLPDHRFALQVIVFMVNQNPGHAGISIFSFLSVVLQQPSFNIIGKTNVKSIKSFAEKDIDYKHN